jgi:hypothetical protein
MIPEAEPSDLAIDLDQEYQLADRDAMRRAIIRRCNKAETAHRDGPAAEEVVKLDAFHAKLDSYQPGATPIFPPIFRFKTADGRFFDITTPKWLKSMPCSAAQIELSASHGVKTQTFGEAIFIGDSYGHMVERCLILATKCLTP